MTKISGKSVLITGGANGMGRIMAERVAAKGAESIILWDIDKGGLRKTADQLAQKCNNVYHQVVDIRNTDKMDEAADDLKSKIGAVDILINNAGVVVGKPFNLHSREDIDFTMEVNTMGMMHMTRNFLSEMIDQGSGHVVNFASAAGLTPNPNMSVYVASKWAAVGWSESLRIELEQSKSNINVTTITPSYIDTGMFEGVKAPLLTKMVKPEAMVDKIIRAIEKNQIIVRAPWSVNILPAARGLLPARMFDIVAGKMFGLYHSMDDFKGHSD